MADKNLTLEEYVEFIKNCTSEHPLTYGNIEIYYFPLGEEINRNLHAGKGGISNFR